MKKYFSKLIQVLVVVIVGVTALLFLMRSYPVLLRVPSDSNMRPRSYCLLNPFRNKAPEHVAETYLNKLREGQVDVISSHIGANKYVPEKEKQWPIQLWRVGNREDVSAKSEIMYWVTRGNGYSKAGYEDAVYFTLLRSGDSWEVKSFSAIY